MTLRVGIVGYGEAGRLHAKHLARAGAQVAGTVSQREIDFDLARYPSVESMLPHVDAVTVAVPNHLHASVALEAIRAGKAVFVEKPLALDAPELDALEAALARVPVPLAVGFRLRFNPKILALRDRLGRPRTIRCIYHLGIEKLAAGKPWTRRASESGGAFFTLGVHAYDLARWLTRALGEPLEELRATAANRGASTDYPLTVDLSGRLPWGTQLTAGTDLRGNTAFRLELVVDGTSFESALMSDAEAEYGAMMAAFVETVAKGWIDADERAELFRVHRDLSAARSAAERRG